MMLSCLWIAIFVLTSTLYSTQALARRPGSPPSSPPKSGSSKQVTPPRQSPWQRYYGKLSSGTATLSELVNRRPPPYKTDRLKSFDELFANHAKVKQLDRYLGPTQSSSASSPSPPNSNVDFEGLKQGWASLRTEEKGLYSVQKMEAAIERHLKVVKGVDASIVEGVMNHWKTKVAKEKGKKYRDKLASGASVELMEKYQERKRKNVIHAMNAKQRAKKKKKGEENRSFQDYLIMYNIPMNLEAKDLEVASRVFRKRYGYPYSAATVALKRYMKEKGYDQKEIDRAVGERRRHFMREERKRYRERSAKGQSAKTSTEGVRNTRIHEYLTLHPHWASTSNL